MTTAAAAVALETICLKRRQSSLFIFNKLVITTKAAAKLFFYFEYQDFCKLTNKRQRREDRLLSALRAQQATACDQLDISTKNKATKMSN